MEFFLSPTSNANIHYRWQNNGKTDSVIFINALGTNFHIWDEVTKNLQNHVNTLVFDKQGHGLSSLNPHTNKLEDYLADLIELFDHLKIDRCHVVGLSVGGMIAQLMSYQFPQRVDKLILCDTRHKIGDAAGWNSRIDVVKKGGVAAVADAVLQRWFSSDFSSTKPEIVEDIKIMLQRCNSDGYIHTCMAIRDADLTEKSKNIKHKTLCVVGSEDKSTVPNDVRDLHQLITDSQFEIIQGSGHLPCVDSPERLSSLILDFIHP
jgi:3-oxoadipate enol-lactonase